MSPAILYFIIGLVAITSIVQNVNALPQFVNNKHISPAGASVTYTFENQITGKTYTVPYFVSSEMKQIRIDLPAEFKSGDIVNGTMVETFPYDLTQTTGFWPLGGAGAETSFDLTPRNLSLIQAGSRAI